MFGLSNGGIILHGFWATWVDRDHGARIPHRRLTRLVLTSVTLAATLRHQPMVKEQQWAHSLGGRREASRQPKPILPPALSDELCCSVTSPGDKRHQQQNSKKQEKKIYIMQATGRIKQQTGKNVSHTLCKYKVPFTLIHLTKWLYF